MHVVNWIPVKKVDSVGYISLHLIVIIHGSEASINTTICFLTPNIFYLSNDSKQIQRWILISFEIFPIASCVRLLVVLTRLDILTCSCAYA
jgi:hypothetical protein